MTDTQGKAPRRSRGRPRDDRDDIDRRDAILDQAELLFAEQGYTATGTREVAERAGVSQALVRYYFGSKEDLFDAVFRRRGNVISGQRHVLLDQLESGPDLPDARALITAYLRPQWDIRQSGPSGAAFVRLQARLHTEPDERAFRLRREVYDASAKRYIAALHRVLPEVPVPIIGLRLAFVIGVYLYMLNGVDRLNDLTDGQIQVSDSQMFEQMVRFLERGMTAPP